MASNTVRLLGGAAGAAVLALLVVALLPRVVPLEDPVPLAAAVPPAAPAVPAAPQTAPVAASGPTVDTFLLGPDGVAVVAGQATPGATVSILLEGVEVAQAQADAGGGFAATAQIAASDQPRTLTFSVNGAAPSGERVLVRPQPQAVAEAATAEASPGAQAAAPAAMTEPAQAIASVEVEDVPAEATAPDGPLASTDVASTDMAEATGQVAAARPVAGAVAAGVAALEEAAPVIVVDDTGAKVLPRAPLVMDRVALDAITYDDSGAVQLAGRAPGDGAVRVYVDNQPLTDGPVGPAGDWRLTLPQVDAGTYTLRIDEITADGSVASRIETPFRRENPVDVAALQQNVTGQRPATNTVQPGSTLWAIARDNMGEGIMYVALFEANRDQIRDPDLIYPGQVFVIPQQ